MFQTVKKFGVFGFKEGVEAGVLKTDIFKKKKNPQTNYLCRNL